MKNLVFFISLGILTLGLVSCKNGSAQTSTEEEQVKEMLVTFYTNYIRMKSGDVFIPGYDE